MAAQEGEAWTWMKDLPVTVLAAVGTAYLGVRVWLARHDEQLKGIRADVKRVDDKVERLVEHLLNKED